MKESSSRSFQSDTKKNPKDFMAITQRSGKELGKSKEVENEKVEIEKEEVKMDKKEEKKEEDMFTLGRSLFIDKPSPIVPPLSFPQRFKKAKLDGKFGTFLNMFKKLEVNIAFADALTKMPIYVKFMKEIMSNKKKLMLIE